MASILVATAVMGLLTLLVALYVVRGMEWRSYDFALAEDHRSTWQSMDAALRHPAAWALGFFLLVFGSFAVAMAAIGAFDLPSNVGTAALAAPFAVMILLFVGLGSYGAVRSRQGSTAEATVVSLLVLGTLFVLGITANLALG